MRHLVAVVINSSVFFLYFFCISWGLLKGLQGIQTSKLRSVGSGRISIAWKCDQITAGFRSEHPANSFALQAPINTVDKAAISRWVFTRYIFTFPNPS